MTSPSPYPRNSRYFGVETAVYVDADGREIPYLRRRQVPQTSSFAVVGVHEVTDGDRADLLAHRYLGDPELWWRLADANGVVDPDELTAVPGRRITITLPEGVTGPRTAG
ncbi:LysM domain-containing protein [Catenuloplanes atrovinosus]|uniref:Nucleoid-associated protein YgaU n=1 Tax=Catenuloplanes atrovinosus TaxID=137266 RepID=A0AAE4C987_9ACTN|nr:LysM domain-containing protein [Catenuloplanes atrovinosus]MDR7275502.1 nucleoid-associated protein YgaU [Catenuloplanes atrovinosus]